MLWGEDDPFGLSLVEATKSALSSAVVELVIIERCGHFWHERQDALLANMRSFLKKVSA